RRGEPPLEEVDDGKALGEAPDGPALVPLQQRDGLEEVQGAVRILVLLSLQEVHRLVVVAHALQRERDAHPPGTPAAPVAIELHQSFIPPPPPPARSVP